MAELVEWLAANGIGQVETIVSDMAGRSRGKLVPAGQVGKRTVKLPEAVFGQTAAGNYFLPEENAADRDMHCQPMPETARIQPRTPIPTAAS